jgi:hypothetical protein
MSTSVHPRSVQPRLDPRLSASDLGRLPVLHAILSALNDKNVSAAVIASHVERLPALHARIGAEYRRWRAHEPSIHSVSLAEQIATIGNRQVEAVLLELLEELTMLSADLAETM